MNKRVKEKFEENKKNMDFYNQDGTQTEQKPKRRFTKKKRPQKIKPISYAFTSSALSDTGDDAFYHVIDTMCESCHIVKTFVDNALSTYTEKNNIDMQEYVLTPDDYFEAIANYAVSSAMPRLLDKKFIHSSLSVSANKIYVRTEGNVAFCFELTYKIEDKKAQITECTGTVTLFAKNDLLVNDLTEHGFTATTAK